MRSKKITLLKVILEDLMGVFRTTAKFCLFLSVSIGLGLIQVIPPVGCTWQDLLYLGIGTYLLSDVFWLMRKIVMKRYDNKS